MRLDVMPVFSRPGVPQDNGRHERMHRDLNAVIRAKRTSSLAEQQKQFDQFRHTFNVERPHEGIEMKRPADVYAPPRRPFPRRQSGPEYESHWETRKVSDNGSIRWNQATIFVGHAFAGQTVALEPTDVDLWSVHFYRFTIGKLDEKRQEFI